MGLRKKNGKWEYRFTVNGEPVSKLTDLEASAENETIAKRMEKKHRDSILKGEQSAKRVRQTAFSKAADEFVEHAKLHYTEHPSSARRIKTSLVSAKVFFGSRPVANIRTPDIERYKVFRLTVNKVQPITLRHDLNNLSLLFAWAIDMELAGVNPVTRKSYKGLPSEAERMHIFTPEEERLYFERAASIPSLHDVGRLMLNQGCRPEEVMRLAVADWDGSDHIVIRKGKTKAARRTLKLTAESRMILERRSIENGGSKWFFPSPRRRGQHIISLRNSHEKVVSPVAVEGKPKPVRIPAVLYDLRHTFATRAARDGMDVVALAAILGHASLRLVMKYVHPQQDHLDQAMTRLEQVQTVPHVPVDATAQTPAAGIKGRAN
jgi:integrase